MKESCLKFIILRSAIQGETRENTDILAHLITKYSWLAIEVSGCPPCVVVRCASTFDVYTLEVTCVLRFL